MRTKIIDISQWNTVSDWDQVKANVDAVIIRMGYTYSRTGDICVDKKYVENRLTCKQKNIPYSLYYFTNAITEEEAIREAQFVIYECRDLSKFILPVFVDSEAVDGQGRADNLDVETRTRCLQAFCGSLQRAGIPAGIYCNENWVKTRIDRTRLPYSLWLASWGVSKPSITDYTIWQYTNVGQIPGIVGNVDISTEPAESSEVSNIQKIISLAISEEGYIEKRNGDINYIYTKDQNVGDANYTKYNYEMHKLQPYNMDYPAAWCMCFISWLFVELFGLDSAKRMLCGDVDDYTITAASRFMSNGRWYSEPRVGDIVFFSNSLGEICHVGLVYKVNASFIHTIEGNTSSAAGVVANGGCVRRKSYQRTYGRIAGYGRPRYV